MAAPAQPSIGSAFIMQTHASASQSSEPAKSNSTSSPTLARLSPLVQRLGEGNLRALLLARVLQPKLAVSDPQDPLELEADRVADQVMRTPDASLPASRHSAPQIQRVRNDCEEKLRRSEESATTVPAVDAATESSIHSSSSRGTSLPA